MGNGTKLGIDRVTPVVDFTSADFTSINEDLTNYAQSEFSDRWTDFNADQYAVVFKELVAYLGDLLSYQTNATVREAFAATAVRRQNLVNIGKPFGATIPGPGAATVDITATLDPLGAYPFNITQTGNSFSNGDNDDEVFFYPTADITGVVYGTGTVTIPCTEGQYFDDLLIGVSNNAADQTWQFPHLSVVESSIVIRVAAAAWTKVTNLVNSSSTDTHYMIVQNDYGQTFAVFGDGTFGSIPGSGSEIRADFSVGGGTRGNLSSATITNIVSSHANITAVTNASGSSGGSNAQTLKQARNSIPNAISTLERGVTTADYAALAVAVSGVEKAIAVSGYPSGSRIIALYIAPTGGGAPSSSLLNTVLTTLETQKMVTNRLRAYSPTYRTMRLSLLIHVNSAYVATEVEKKVRYQLLNTAGTGLLNFSQLGFMGLDSDDNLIFSQTNLQDEFSSLEGSGVRRVEIKRMDVLPAATEKEGGNTGDGTVNTITTNTLQRRRQYLIKLQSATEYAVYERIVGFATRLTDTAIIDDDKIFDDEGVASYSGYEVIPDIDKPSTVASVASASDQSINLAGGSSGYSLTQIGVEYALYNPTPTIVTVGSAFTTADGSVSFTVTAGATPFINGDYFTLDIYPHVGDIQLRTKEYPSLTDANFETRTSGGTNT